MKQKYVFPGIILIGTGTYFLLKQLDINYIGNLLTWPSLLIIIGIAFLVQGYSMDPHSIFPGVLLVCLGLHFHFLFLLKFWPDHWAIYLIIFALAFLLKYQKTNKGLIQGLVLFGIGILGLFYDGMMTWMSWIGKGINWIESYWPITLIAAGFYLLFFKKK